MLSPNILILFLFCEITMVVTLKRNPCFDTFSSVQNDRYMVHHAYSKVVTHSVYVCAANCLMSATCLSISYDKLTNICHLNDNNTTVTDIVRRKDFFYSDISLWPRRLSGACSVTSCPDNTRCQVDRLQRATCIAEFQGCGAPPEVAGSQRDYEGHFLSAVVAYTCNADYMFCHSKTTSVCQSTGQWEDVSGLCGQLRWYNAESLMDLYLPCGAKDKLKVTVVGTPMQATKTTINFFSGSDNLFHMDFRYNIADTINKTIINTLLDGVWGTEIILPTIPLVVGQRYSITLTLKNGLYTVTVDGMVFYQFTERAPGLNPEYFRIYQDGPIDLVEFSI